MRTIRRFFARRWSSRSSRRGILAFATAAGVVPGHPGCGRARRVAARARRHRSRCWGADADAIHPRLRHAAASSRAYGARHLRARHRGGVAARHGHALHRDARLVPLAAHVARLPAACRAEGTLPFDTRRPIDGAGAIVAALRAHAGHHTVSPSSAPTSSCSIWRRHSSRRSRSASEPAVQGEYACWNADEHSSAVRSMCVEGDR